MSWRRYTRRKKGCFLKGRLLICTLDTHWHLVLYIQVKSLERTRALQKQKGLGTWLRHQSRHTHLYLSVVKCIGRRNGWGFGMKEPTGTIDLLLRAHLLHSPSHLRVLRQPPASVPLVVMHNLKRWSWYGLRKDSTHQSTLLAMASVFGWVLSMMLLLYFFHCMQPLICPGLWILKILLVNN